MQQWAISREVFSLHVKERNPQRLSSPRNREGLWRTSFKGDDIVYSLMKVKEVRKRTARSYESCE